MNQILEADLLIVGAGPSGCAAAITARKAGLSVILIDKATFPRDKTCGDGITTSALRKFEQIGLDPNSVSSWHAVDDVIVAGPGGTVVNFPLPRGRGQFAAVAKRIDLDNAVVDLAIDAGAQVIQNTALTALEFDEDSIAATTPKHSISAKYVIAADGMFSTTRKLCDRALSPTASPAKPHLGEWHAFRQYFENVDGPGSEKLFVSFEHDLLPGYFWSFPLGDGNANVGFGIQRGGRYNTQDMKHLWQELLARPHIAKLLGPNALPVERHKAWPIPARVDDVAPTAGRVFFVGDAIAACDPMSGEGIGQALQSGIAAASCIATHFSDADKAAAAYTGEIEGNLVPDHKMSMLLIRALQHRKGAKRALQVAGTNSWTRRNFARWLFEDYPRAVVFTPSRWHRKVFSSDGAYKH